MELDPARVGRVARAWDAQHLDLAAAGHQIGGASAGGFTPAVVGAASRFAITWARAAAQLGDRCESEADSMRTSVRLALDADHASAAQTDRTMREVAELR